MAVTLTGLFIEVTMSSKYLSPFIENLEPYVPGEQIRSDKLIKLNTNESPYPPTPKIHSLLNASAIDSLRLYPDPDNAGLVAAIADNHQLGSANICVANGSDEILGFAFQAFFKQSLPILFPDITYGFYPVYCGLFDIEYKQMPLNQHLQIDLADYRQPNGGIIFPNPNAPTGLGLELDAIEALLVANPDSVVIVDEAYVDFGCDSAITLIDRFDNLLVSHTFSKSRSLAGARVGFAAGSAPLIEGLKRVKNSFNPYSLDALAELCATSAIQDTAYFEDCCQKIIHTREWTKAELRQLGFEVLESKANFVLVKPAGIDAEQLFLRLREQNILIRYFSKPRIASYVRISIGTDAEMQRLLSAIKAILAAG